MNLFCNPWQKIILNGYEVLFCICLYSHIYNNVMVLSCHFGVLQTFPLYNIELPGYSSEILPSVFHIKNRHAV